MFAKLLGFDRRLLANMAWSLCLADLRVELAVKSEFALAPLWVTDPPRFEILELIVSSL